MSGGDREVSWLLHRGAGLAGTSLLCGPGVLEALSNIIALSLENTGQHRQRLDIMESSIMAESSKYRHREGEEERFANGLCASPSAKLRASEHVVKGIENISQIIHPHKVFTVYYCCCKLLPMKHFCTDLLTGTIPFAKVKTAIHHERTSPENYHSYGGLVN